MSSPSSRMLSWSNYEQFLLGLQDLCRAGRTGTVHLSSGSILSGTVGLRNGDIVAVALGEHSGAVVIPLLRSIRNGEYHFEENVAPPPDRNLPATHEILKRLGATPVAPSDRPIAADSSFSTKKSAAIQIRAPQIVEEEARNAFGPIGALLCAEYVEKVGSPEDLESVERMVAEISQKTGGSSGAALFRKRVMDRVLPDRVF
jgi:hypothetical protein